MKYDLRKLAQMVAVARAGSFSGAADELHITQPALSRNVAALEKELGIKIFERGRNGASLTPAGALAVEATEALLREADSLEHNLAMFGTGDAGRLAFGMGPMLGSLILPGLCRELLTQRPLLRLRSVIKPARELQQELLADRIELFYCGAQQISASSFLQVEQIARLPIAHVVRAGHPLAEKRHVGMEEQRSYPLLAGVEMPTATSSGGELVCDNYHILRDATQHSDGIWITSPLMIKTELADGSLHELPLGSDVGTTFTDVCQVSRAGFDLSPAAVHVSDYLHRFFSDKSNVME